MIGLINKGISVSCLPSIFQPAGNSQLRFIIGFVFRLIFPLTSSYYYRWCMAAHHLRQDRFMSPMPVALIDERVWIPPGDRYLLTDIQCHRQTCRHQATYKARRALFLRLLITFMTAPIHLCSDRRSDRSHPAESASVYSCSARSDYIGVATKLSHILKAVEDQQRHFLPVEITAT